MPTPGGVTFLSSVGVCDATSHHLMLWVHIRFLISSCPPSVLWEIGSVDELFVLHSSVCNTSTSCCLTRTGLLLSINASSHIWSLMKCRWWRLCPKAKAPSCNELHVPTSVAVSWTSLSFGTNINSPSFRRSDIIGFVVTFSRSLSFDEIMLAASNCINWCGEVDDVRIRRALADSRHSLTRLVWLWQPLV